LKKIEMFNEGGDWQPTGSVAPYSFRPDSDIPGAQLAYMTVHEAGDARQVL
jgi:hypothetical protein